MQSENFAFRPVRAVSETLTLAHQHPACGAGQQPNEAPQDSQTSWRWPFAESMCGLYHKKIPLLHLQGSPVAC